MSQFALTQGGNTYKFSIDGKVSNGSDDLLGNWSTNDDNHILVHRLPDADGATPEPEAIAVKWMFNQFNQFCLCRRNGDVVYNFHLVREQIPSYEVRNGALRVRPSQHSLFEFFVQCDWNLNEKHQLEVNVGNETFALDGILSDTKSRFTYHIQDRQHPWITSRLTFPGRWEMETAEGEPRMRFHYRGADGEERVFHMPGRLIVERGTNQFRYTYDRENRSFGITLVGFLKISETFEISYILDKQQSNEGDELVAQTTFVLRAAFHGDQFQGDLRLALLKDDNTPGSFLLSITGNYTAVLGETQLMVGFRFSQRRNGRLVTTSFGFGGALVWRGGHLHYEFSADSSGAIELSLGVDIRFQDGPSVNSRLNIVGENGQVKAVTFMLGVTF